MNFKAIKIIPVSIALGVMGFVCLLQFLSVKLASPPGEAKKEADAAGEKRERFYFDLINRLEWMTYDWRVRQASKRASALTNVAPNLGYVACADDSVRTLLDGTLGPDFQYGLLWPRQLYGRLVRELKTQGAKVVAFDIMMLEARPDHPVVKLRDGSFVGSDDYFIQAAREAGNVLLAAIPGGVPPPQFRTNVLALGDILAETDSDSILRRARAFRDYRIWHPLIMRWATLEGIDLDQAQIQPDQIILTRGGEAADKQPNPIGLDAEGKVDLRRFYRALGEPMAAGQPTRERPFIDERVWSIGIRLAAAELNLDLEHPVIDLPHRRLVLRGPNGLERVIPVEPSGHFYIDWSLSHTDPRLTKVNFESVLAMGIMREAGETNDIENIGKDRLLVVGSTATGSNLTDLGATPIERKTPLMSKHWNIANAIICDRFIWRTSPLGELALILVMSSLSAVLTWKLRALWASFWVVILILAYALLSLWLFVAHRYWMPMILPVCGALVMTHVCMVTYRVIVEQNERRRVKNIFSKIVSPDVVNELLGAERLSLGGALRSLTVLFADVRGFTQMTDDVQKKAEEYVRVNNLKGAAAEAYFEESARETLATVNLYLAAIADNVKKHYGTLDKYIGDCVMAFWGAPTLNPKHALACVRAAIDSQRAMYELNQQRAVENKRREQENAARVAAGQPPRSMLALLSLGTGINTGTVTVGLMGSDAHILNYTVFGREVNLASRLEGVSGRGRIIISETTLGELQRDDPALAATCVSLPPVTVKGISQAVKIYEVPWKLAATPAPAPALGQAVAAASPPSPAPASAAQH
jgi:class 3 adenylate cyclase